MLFLDRHEQPASGVLEVSVRSVACEPSDDVVEGVSNVQPRRDAAPILAADQHGRVLVLQLAPVEDAPDFDERPRDDVERVRRPRLACAVRQHFLRCVRPDVVRKGAHQAATACDRSRRVIGPSACL